MVMSRGLYSTARGEARLLTEVEELEVAGSELVLDERALADLRQRCARPQGGFVTAIRTGRISLRAVARGHASRSSRSRWLRVRVLSAPEQESTEVGRSERGNRRAPEWAGAG